jgi:hypothetical protein
MFAVFLRCFCTVPTLSLILTFFTKIHNRSFRNSSPLLIPKSPGMIKAVKPVRRAERSKSTTDNPLFKI